MACQDRARWSCTSAQRIFTAMLSAGTIMFSTLQLRKSRQGKFKSLVQSYIDSMIKKKKKYLDPSSLCST